MGEQLSDLVLQTRLVMLRGSLTKVCDAIKMLEQARQQGRQASRAESRVTELAQAMGADEARLREVVERITDACSARPTCGRPPCCAPTPATPATGPGWR